MAILVGGIEPAENKSSNTDGALEDGKKPRFKERRKNLQDRRKSVREGIFVSLSFKADRRVVRDRRKVG